MSKLFAATTEVPKLIVNRRTIAAGLAALVGGSASAAVPKLRELSNVSLGFDPSAFSGEMRDGLFLPDYRQPMVRLVYDNGATTNWYRYQCVKPATGPRAGATAVAIETCAPDKHGNPRYTSLEIA